MHIIKKKVASLMPVRKLNDFCPIVVGRICSPYGILGWLRVISFTDKFDNVMSYQPWFVRLFSEWRCLYLENWKRYNTNCYFIVKIKNIYDRDIAHLLSNHEIFIEALQLPSLSYGEHYWKDVIGCRVIGISGYIFGIVISLIETGANDVLVVKHNIDSSCHVFLIPFIQSVVKNTDFLGRVINVDWDPQF